MAEHFYSATYNSNVTRITSALLYFRLRVSGTLTRVDVSCASASSVGSPAKFDLNKGANAAAMASVFAPVSRPTIALGATTGAATGLSVSVAAGDFFSLDVDDYSTGGIIGPITLMLTIDDGVGAGSVTWAAVDKTTSSLADIQVRSAADLSSGVINPARLGSGTANSGSILYGNNTWASPPVSSFNGRTGAIVAQANDYTLSEIDLTGSSLADLAVRSASDLTSGTVNPSRLGSGVADSSSILYGNSVWGAPPSPPVTSIYGRTGAVTAQAGDILWADITKTGSSLADLSTRSASDLTSGTINPSRLGSGSPDSSKVLFGDSSWGVPSGAVSSVFGRSGAVVATSGDYLWSDINKATSSLADIQIRSAADLSSGVINTARLGSGSATSSTYLRGDSTWATIAGGGSTINSTDTVIPYRLNSGAFADSQMWRESADILALRNGTTAQTLFVYNNWSSAGAVYERGFFRYTSNVLEIGHQSSSTPRDFKVGGSQCTNMLLHCSTGGGIKIQDNGNVNWIFNSANVGALEGQHSSAHIIMNSSAKISFGSTIALVRSVNGKLKVSNNSTGDALLISFGAEMIEGVLATVAAVDLNVTTKTTLYTVPTGKTAVVTKVVVRNASTSLTTASFSIGQNANADDIIADETWTELTGNTLYTQRLAKDGATVAAAAQVIGAKCSIAQGAAATATITVFGYLY